MLCEKRDLTDVIKFIAAIMVVNGHLFKFYINDDVASWVNIGSQCVALFLFFSAYGLWYSYEKKGTAYLHGFLTKRLSIILIPLVTAYVFSLVIYYLCIGSIDWEDVLETLYWGGKYLQFSWYVSEILILYITFWVCMKLAETYKFMKSFFLALLCIATIFVAILFIILHLPSWWLTGLPCFALGFVYCKYEKYIKELIGSSKNQWGWIIIVLTCIFIVLFRWPYFDTLIGLRFLRPISYFGCNIIFVCLVVSILNIIQVKRNYSSKLTQSYYEIYLLQNAIMVLMSSLGLSVSVFWLSTMCGLLCLSICMHLFNNKIVKLINA